MCEYICMYINIFIYIYIAYLHISTARGSGSFPRQGTCRKKVWNSSGSKVK